MIQPRYLTTMDACVYLGCTPSGLNALVRDGYIPGPIVVGRRMKRWDREAIDAAVGKRRDAGTDVDEAVQEIIREQAAAKGRPRRQTKAA